MALPVAVAALCIDTATALADGGAGDSPGGVDQAVAAGGAGGSGGGGGAGVTGGRGGDAYGAVGGVGGSSPGAAGGAGGSSIVEGGGGGGGAHGFTDLSAPGTLPHGATTGGAGGVGGFGGGGSGGGGGAGGWGAVLTGSGQLGTLAVTVSGGNGGNGGGAEGNGGSESGSGGTGGIGLALTGSATALTIGEEVTGGAGGAGGLAVDFGASGGGRAGNGGGGGTGITTSGGTLTINALVRGGAGGAGGRVSGGGRAGNGGGGGTGITTSGGTLTINASVTGGYGGAGGMASGSDFAGLGGAGGAGITTSGGTLTVNASVTGGNGGAGGTASGGEFGGSGGAGGAGITTSGGTLTINASVTGGNGGNGGDGHFGGNGGDGGTGISGSGFAVTIGTAGSVAGGSAGSAGSGSASYGGAGAGGAGISGSDLTVINAGSISGGSGANAITFTGGINSLELRAGSTISGNVVGTGSDTFRLGGSTHASFDVSLIGASAQYQGFSTFEKTGTSTWTLTGANTTATPWTINAGALAVNGSLAHSSFTVNSGGTLNGIGTVGAVTVARGGTFAPGASGTPGTSMTVAGNLAFQSGAIYLVQVDPATASLANVTGTATLGGNVLAAFAPGSYLKKQYTILHSSGLGGTRFSALGTTNLPAGFTAILSYTSTDVRLHLTAVLGTPATIGTTRLGDNHQGIANTLNNFFNNGGTLPPNFLTVFELTGGNVSAALSQLSGEVGTGSQQVGFNALTQFMGVLSDPIGHGGGFGGAGPATGYAEEGEQANAYASRRTSDAFAMFTKAAPASYVPRWNVWASGFGGGQSISGNAGLGTSDTTSRIAGVAVGADYRFSPNTIAGFALAGGGSSFGVSNLSSGRSDLFQAGAYARHTIGAAYVTGALAYGWQDVTTTRNVTIAGLDVLRARFNANALSGRLEGGYRFVAPVAGGVGVTPYAAGQFTTLWLPSYAEQAVTGNNTFALDYGAQTVTDTRSELGIRTDKSWALPGAVLTLRGREAWMHDYNPNRSIGATFTALPGASFVVNGATQPRDAWLSTLAADVTFVSGWSLAATLDSEWAQHATTYTGKGTVRYQW